jgi:hypothetical protein
MATIAENRTVERIWLKSYPPGVPAEADVDRYSSVRDIFLESCSKFASLPAFTCMGSTIDYAKLERLSRDFAAWLTGVACPTCCSIRSRSSAPCARDWWS